MRNTINNIKKAMIIMAMLIIMAMPVLSADEPNDIKVNILEYNPNPIQPGQVMDLIIQVSSEGDGSDDISLGIVEEYPFIIEKTQDYERAKDLGSVHYAQQLHFRIRIADDAKDGLTPIRVRYSVGNEGSGSSDVFIEKTFDINIETFDSRLDVTRVIQNPETLEPGEEGTITLKLVNQDDKALKNIDVIMDLTNSYDTNTNMENTVAVQAMINARLEEVNRRVASGLSPLKGVTPMTSGGSGEDPGSFRFTSLAPVDSTNQQRIPILRASEMTEVIFKVRALPDASPNIYAIPVYINYNDEDNNPFHVRVDIPATIDSESDVFAELTSTSLRTTDFAGKVSFTIANRGLSKMQFVTAKLQEDDSFRILTAPTSIYIGALMPGESKVVNYSVIPEEKNLSVPLKITYSDAFNVEKTVEKEIGYEIINKNYYRDMPYEMSLAWIILGIVVLILSVFFMRQLRKRD